MKYGDLPANWYYDDLAAEWGTSTCIYCDVTDIPKLASRWGWLQWNCRFTEPVLEEQARLRSAIERIATQWREEHKKPFPHDIDEMLMCAARIAKSKERLRSR